MIEKDMLILVFQAVLIPLLGGILVAFWKDIRKVTGQTNRIEERIEIVNEAVREMRHLSQVVTNLDKTLAILGQQMSDHKTLVDKHDKVLTTLESKFLKLRGSVREIILNMKACQEKHDIKEERV